MIFNSEMQQFIEKQGLTTDLALCRIKKIKKL